MRLLLLIAAFLSSLAAAEGDRVNPVERLNARLEAKELTLTHDGTRRGYLLSLLHALDIDPASQMLVFSKTSLQMDHISPEHPRALYFNDEVSVGFVPYGELLELATFDPARGIVFYTLDSHAGAEKPLKLVQRDRDCGSCHSSPKTPLVVQSVYPMSTGTPFISLGTIMPLEVDHRTPLADRWGGWYVTGTHGRVRHMGNSLPRNDFHPFDLEGPQNITALADSLAVPLPGKPDLTPYPEPTSDLIALMTFDHQMFVTNAITRLNKLYRADRARDEKVTNEAVEELVEALFFSREAKLDDPVRGASAFAEHFTQRGPRDAQGRSLRDFDLQRRLFRYPLSYMIDSPIFDALPEAAALRVRTRIRQVLAGEGGAAFVHLSPVDRVNIGEILSETKPKLLQ